MDFLLLNDLNSPRSNTTT